MAPRSEENQPRDVLTGHKVEQYIATNQIEEKPFKTEIVWKNVAAFVFLHYCAFQVYHFYRRDLFMFHTIYGFIAGYGIVAGAHRLWSHRSFKANFPLQVFLMILQTISMENDTIEWVRDHRVHHKYSDTNADPTNSNRGFFFSHMGWLMCKKHPDVKKYGAKIDMSDVEAEPVLQFQRKYYYPLVFLFSFFIPMSISMYFWPLTIWQAFCAVICRYVLSLHIVWCTNSVAHIGSWKPYDKTIAASDSLINGTFTFGEGWHNFHHTFPWDYKVSEKPLYRHNFGMILIDFFAWIGWATDLKVASEDLIRKRVLRTGDGSHPYAIEEARKKKMNEDYLNNNVCDTEISTEASSEVFWGLGDTDMPKEEIQGITTLNKKFE
ncbi:unnamed protein product [Chironomus riparius]|uniref:Fatty acid desaturase domain-containing protein n=1 Tax=Chironomus riparius TaxID=315576 RepID=A0A9N9S5Z6_9DIPT|nr:unnamed protein product [Chironomus riparius]